MNKPETLTNKSPLLSFPQVAIRELVADLVLQLYGVEWTPRVVRQQRNIKVGTLDYIDYAIPFFDLAQKLQASPDKIAEQVYSALVFEYKNDVDRVSVLKGAEAEAVSGYVNFCLSEHTINNAIKSAVAWYQAPSLDLQKGSDDFLVIAHHPPKHINQDIDCKTYEYLNYFYNFLNKKHEIKFILDDFSEDFCAELASAVVSKSSQPLSKLERAIIYRESRYFLANLKTKNGAIESEAKILLLEYRKKHEKFLECIGLDVAGTVYESGINKKVHLYLNKGGDLSSEGIFKDPSSNGVYFADGIDTLPLRSASGMLFSLAYTLYELENATKHIKDNIDVKTLVVIAPSNLHLLIHSFVRLSIRDKTISKKVICFDPKTVKADVVSISKSVPQIDTHFSNILTCLKSKSNKEYKDIHKRQLLLALIELPVEFSDLATNLNLPGMFDSVSQAIEVVAQLKSES